MRQKLAHIHKTFLSRNRVLDLAIILWVLKNGYIPQNILLASICAELCLYRTFKFWRITLHFFVCYDNGNNHTLWLTLENERFDNTNSTKGKQLSAGENSKAFTFARNLIKTKSKCIAYTGSSRCSNCRLGWNFHTVLVLTILWELFSNFGEFKAQTADLQIYFSRFWWQRFGFFCMMYCCLSIDA